MAGNVNVLLHFKGESRTTEVDEELQKIDNTTAASFLDICQFRALVCPERELDDAPDRSLWETLNRFVRPEDNIFLNFGGQV